jgi:hypothetical protein
LVKTTTGLGAIQANAKGEGRLGQPFVSTSLTSAVLAAHRASTGSKHLRRSFACATELPDYSCLQKFIRFSRSAMTTAHFSKRLLIADDDPEFRQILSVEFTDEATTSPQRAHCVVTEHWSR